MPKFIIAFLLLLMIVPNLQMAISQAKRPKFTPSDNWYHALERVKDNADGDYIIVWWDYGYWIERISGREAYVDPGQDAERINQVARMLLSQPHEDIPAQYLILDYKTVYQLREAVAYWAGYVPEDYADTFMVRLYESGGADNWTMVYESGGKESERVKVFKHE